MGKTVYLLWNILTFFFHKQSNWDIVGTIMRYSFKFKLLKEARGVKVKIVLCLIYSNKMNVCGKRNNLILHTKLKSDHKLVGNICIKISLHDTVEFPYKLRINQNFCVKYDHILRFFLEYQCKIIQK